MNYFLNTQPGPLILLVRHGRTAFNDPKNPIVRAWADEPISDEGKIDVQMLSYKLKPYNPQYIYSSDFMRDTETAMILSSRLGISGKETSFDSRTWDVGEFTGKPETEVGAAINRYADNPWDAPPGSSESFNDFSGRWQRFLDSKMEFAARVETMRPSIIVTHGRNIAVTQSYLQGLNFNDCQMPLPAGFAVISVQDDRSLRMDFATESESVQLDA